MDTLILTQAEVRSLLPPARCIELVSDALCALGRGEGQNPLRQAMQLEDGRGLLAMMPGSLGGADGALGIKLIAIFPGNQGTPLDSHQGLVALFDGTTGVPTAILDGSEVTGIRTAAASALATRSLANEGPQTLALLGAGVQARTHLAAMLQVRPIEQVRVYCRDQARREAFAARESERHGVAVLAAASARAAVEGAGLICTLTSAREPVLRGQWLSPGAHINAVGACQPGARELDGDAVARARVFVDRRDSAESEAGDLLLAREEGALCGALFEAELGEVLLGRAEGRRQTSEITLFESLGIAAFDLVVARHLLEEGRRQGVGTSVPLGGLAD